MPSSSYTIPLNPIIGTNYPSGVPVSRCSNVKARKRTWTNTPGYSSTPRPPLPINSYVDERWDISQPVMVKTESWNADGSLVERVWDGRTQSGLESLITEYATLANSRLRTTGAQQNETVLTVLSRVADAKVNIGVALAEASKTSNMILDSANRVYRAYRSFRRGDLGGIAQNLNISPRRLHKSWLEYQYGWMPLLSDVKNGAEFFAQRHVGRPLRFSASARTQDVTDKTDTGALEGWDQLTKQVVYKRTCRVKLECEIVNPHLSSLQQLGVTNPALVLWELVPFSFVFDWFISVGSWLQGLTALHGVSVRRAFISWEKNITWTRSGHMNKVSFGPGLGYRAPYDSLITGMYRAYERNPYSVDVLALYPPVQQDVFNWRRTLSSLALLQAKSRRFG